MVQLKKFLASVETLCSCCSKLVSCKLVIASLELVSCCNLFQTVHQTLDARIHRVFYQI